VSHHPERFLLRLGEVTLKKRNRNDFIRALANRIQQSMGDLPFQLRSRHKKMMLVSDIGPELVRHRLSRVFGLHSISPVFPCSLDVEEMKEKAWALLSPFAGAGLPFAVKVKRTNKAFPIPSPELQTILAEHVLRQGLQCPVNLKTPQLKLDVAVEFHRSWFSLERWKGAGGLPTQKRNRLGLLLSGGIDSPVAGYLMQKRGAFLDAFYFHTPPFTVEAAREKVMDLANVLADYQGQLDLTVIHMTEGMKAIKALCDDRYSVLLSRRLMLRIAERLAQQQGCLGLVSGESLGQVASQTLDNMLAVAHQACLPVYRPLIGMDKQEIIDIARQIGTFETSIKPFADCCSLFAPEMPETHAKLPLVLEEEAKLDLETLIQAALAQQQRVVFHPRTRR
jgi:thiamine biosynthesis protein ThiI